MSRIFNAIEQKQQDRPLSRERQESAVSPEQSAEVKHLPGSSRNKRSAPSGSLPLFHSDPEENVRLWMEKYFADGSLSREAAILEWLARPPEFRVQSFLEAPANSEKSSNSGTSAAAPQEGANGARSNQAASEPKLRSERIPQLIPGGTNGLQSDRSRTLPKFLFR